MPAKDQGFTEDQVEDFKEVFQLFDTKGDGLIQVYNNSTSDRNWLKSVKLESDKNIKNVKILKFVRSDMSVTYDMIRAYSQSLGRKVGR